jgi:hypothetical protein
LDVGSTGGTGEPSGEESLTDCQNPQEDYGNDWRKTIQQVVNSIGFDVSAETKHTCNAEQRHNGDYTTTPVAPGAPATISAIISTVAIKPSHTV